MKQITIGLGTLLVATIVINLIMSNFWVQVAIVSIVAIIVILGLFSIGVWVGSKRTKELIELGADIVLRGQQINDTWDARKMQALGQFGREVIKVKQDSLAAQQYPALPPAWVDGTFTIAGLDDTEGSNEGR